MRPGPRMWDRRGKGDGRHVRLSAVYSPSRSVSPGLSVPVLSVPFQALQRLERDRQDRNRQTGTDGPRRAVHGRQPDVTTVTFAPAVPHPGTGAHRRLCSCVHEWLGFAVPVAYHMSLTTAPVGYDPTAEAKRVTSQVGGGRVSSRARGIPEATVARLAVYLRVLSGLEERGEHPGSTISSTELAQSAGVNSAKLRKDLSFLGSYGIRGVGYDVVTLTDQISHTLGAHRAHRVALVGLGNLGQALAGYPGFSGRGFVISALFDADPERIL